MFLAPAIVAALGYELASAISATSNAPTTNKPIVDLPVEQPNLRRGGVDYTPAFRPRQMPLEIHDITDPSNIVEIERLGNDRQVSTYVAPTTSTAVIPYQHGPSFLDTSIAATCKIVGSLVPRIPFVDVERLCVAGLTAGISNRAKLAKYVAKTYSKLSNMARKKSQPSRTKATAVNSSVPGGKARKQKSLMPATGGFIAGISAPAAKGTVVGRVGNPVQRNIKRGVLVKHTEMLSVLTSSTAANGYKAISYTINPAKADVFPWLSSIATSYDKYRIRRMAVHLNSMRPTSEAGKYGVAYDPDSTDDPPVDRSELYAMYKHVEGPIWQSLSFNVPVSHRELFCNSHTSGDSKLIDDGQIVFFADLVSATSSPLADIIVDYEVELLDPQQALFCTSTIDYPPLTFVVPVVPAPLRIAGPKLATIFMISAANLRVVAAPGYYKLVVFVQDTAATTPIVVFGNDTANTIHGVKLGSTTLHLSTIYFRIVTNSFNASALTSLGDTIRIGITGAADYSVLEKMEVSLSRVAPPTYASIVTAGYTATAPGATF